MNKINLYIEHLKAWWRGDVVAITSVFHKALAELEAHGKYVTAIADNQAMAARDLAERSKALYAQADQTAAIKAKLAALVS